MSIRIGVDAGGTFTDVCLVEKDGTLAVYKLPSTPDDPSDAIIGGVATILKRLDLPADAVNYLGHGTTVATNALLQGRGARTGVLTTEGFRDLLEIGRQRRPDLYDLQVDKPVPLARRAERFEVPERITATGAVCRAIDHDAVRTAVRALRARGVEAIAVCFLYSYLVPEHEDVVAEIVAEEFPDAYLSLSHDVVAEFREYERLSTTVVNSFVGPLMSRYIRHLQQRVGESGILTAPFITQSNGGIVSLESAAETPVRTVLSGPAAGVVGATVVSSMAGYTNLITFDMGGTSTDVALITGGQPSINPLQEIAGYPIRSSMIDINTVGAGGGSIAWVDSGGHLKVGPQSAGADPGPACYDQGGTEATVTDANVALGILSREALLGGQMPIDALAADAAIDRLAAQLNLPLHQVAQGIIDLATVNMARAIRVISTERGYDPRDYTLVAFGGAGPLHASRLARELDISTVLVPTIPGLLCALGLLVADLKTDFSRTQVAPADATALGLVNGCFDELMQAADTWFDREQIAPADRSVRRIADMRYVGQNYELSIDVPNRALTESDLPEILAVFCSAHDQAYGYADANEPVQFVTLRLEATGQVPKPKLPRLPAGASSDIARSGWRHMFLSETGDWQDVPLYDRARLGSGAVIVGPAVVEQMDSTTLILGGQRATVDDYGNLILSEAQEEIDE